MIKKTSTEGLDESSWEEAVNRYLEKTPDYFLRHPALLAALTSPPPEAGRAVSLVERQVRVLRDRNESLARELRELIQFARDNDQLSERLQRFALAMIESAGLDDVLDTARDMLRQEFGLDAVALRIGGQPLPANPRAEFVGADDPLLDGLLVRLAERNHQPVCGAAQEPALLAELFGEPGAGIRSTAVVALTRRGLRGALVLGSTDPNRFRADMGTLYLARLGDLLIAAIARQLTVAG